MNLHVFKKKEEGLYIKVLLWAYERQKHGFTRQELDDVFATTPELRRLIHEIFFWGTNEDRPLIKQFDTRKEVGYLTLTDKGISAAVDYLELRQAELGGRIATGIGVAALLIAVWTGVLTQKSLSLTRESLELSAQTVLEIVPDYENLSPKVDKVLQEIGHIPVSSSTVPLLLINNSTPAIEDVDIRMNLWLLDRDSGGGRFKVCPFGYVNHTKNPEFFVFDLNVGNVLNKKFSLDSGEAYPFSFSYAGLTSTDLWDQSLSESAVVLVKIDVRYRKRVSQVDERYTKIFRIFNDASIIDIDLAPEHGYMVGNGKIETRENLHDLPSVFYPFENPDFVSYLKSLVFPDNFAFAECDEFDITKEVKRLSY